jgi:hypothetical protein
VARADIQEEVCMPEPGIRGANGISPGSTVNHAGSDLHQHESCHAELVKALSRLLSSEGSKI